MKKWILFLLLIGLSPTLFAQDHIGDTRTKVRKNLQRYAERQGVKEELVETDSSLLFALNDPRYKPVDFLFLFDADNQCTAEVRTGCDTCIGRFLQAALDNRKYQWRQTGPATFLSNTRFRLQMVLSDDVRGSRLRVERLHAKRSELYRRWREGQRL